MLKLIALSTLILTASTDVRPARAEDFGSAGAAASEPVRGSAPTSQFTTTAWYVGQTPTAHRFVLFDSIAEAEAPNTVSFDVLIITRDRDMIATGNGYSFHAFETDCVRLRSRVTRWAMYNTDGDEIAKEEEPAEWFDDVEGSVSRQISDAICGDQIPSSEVLSTGDLNRFFAAALGGRR